MSTEDTLLCSASVVAENNKRMTYFGTEALPSQTYIPNTLAHHDAHTKGTALNGVNGRQNRVNGDGFLVNRISNRRESDYNSPATPMTLFEDLNTLWYNYDILGDTWRGRNIGLVSLLLL